MNANLIDISLIPEPEAARALALWQLCFRVEQTQIEATDFLERYRNEFQWLCYHSEFFANFCQADPRGITALISSGDLSCSYDVEYYAKRLRVQCLAVEHKEDLMRELRHLRRREMARIVWRDILQWADFTETTRDLSGLADACVAFAVEKLYQWQLEENGTPCGSQDQSLDLMVLALGKLGGRELNFSSDIDLIFAFAQEGVTQGGRRPLDHQEFFTRLGQQLIQVLSANTEHGFVFRVDMRLRPFGDSGPLAASFPALEQYYQSHGRDWERYALIKARLIAGNIHQGQELMELIRPFVYRRYLDYSAFASLREMKQLIVAEVKRKGQDHNIKLGVGGIREIEFIGQAFQLIRGGRQNQLQVREILVVLAVLAQLHYLPPEVVAALIQAYIFLRTVENRLQEYADQQNHLLPQHENRRRQLALVLGFKDWSAFYAELSRHRAAVNQCFQQVFASPQVLGESAGDEQLTLLWSGGMARQEAELLLHSRGYSEGASLVEKLTQFRQGAFIARLGAKGRERLKHLMPLLLVALRQAKNSQRCLERILVLLHSIARRTAYLALLVENPKALAQLVKLCDASHFIATTLAKYPLLLDELLDPQALYAPLLQVELQAQLQQMFTAFPQADFEQQLEILRQFKQINVLRVASADVSGIIPLMKVSDYLTDIATVCLNAAYTMASLHLQEKHGVPQMGADGQHQIAPFLVVAYGKFGGMELGYASDLDLVFLQGSAGGLQTTSGPAVIDNVHYFIRLSQRLVHIITTQTPAGLLYEVDLRLRPNGEAGILVNSLSAFEHYQETQAWTYEHQALIRARCVAGSAHLQQAFAAVRARILCRPRDPQRLRQDILNMRLKMRGARPPAAHAEFFNLKHSEGGIIDIEFIVQFLVLKYAHEYPVLSQHPDHISLLEKLGATGLLTPTDAEMLSKIYQDYRAAVHRLSLDAAPPQIGVQEYITHRQWVIRLWQQLFQ